MDYRRKRNDESSEDSPIYSRLFVVCDKQTSEECINKAFSSFGTIEDIRMPRNHNTGELKGIAFVKFYKTSDAAKALEALHSKNIEGCNRPLKVMVAANRSDIQSDEFDNDKYKRLFITIPKTMDEEEVNSSFAAYGRVDSIIIQRDRNTGEGRGFAYVKFTRFSEAALAFEECEKKFRAIFAMPKGFNRRVETAYESKINNLAMSSNNMKTSLVSMMNSRPEGYTRVNFICSPYLTQMHMEKLFDIIPGLANCRFYVDLVRNCGKGTATYSNSICASYAVEKLNRFEYPPGVKIFVRPDTSKFDSAEEDMMNIPNVVSNLKKTISETSSSSSPDLAQLAAAIAEASKLIKVATAGVSDDNIPDSNDLNYCSVKLPPTQPLADIDSPVAKRCFLVCKPQPPPLTVLRDIFCRFGDLINVYTLPNKTVGYARFATTEAADSAIATLHGAEICGVRMKVIEADEEAPSKRMRYESKPE